MLQYHRQQKNWSGCVSRVTRSGGESVGELPNAGGHGCLSNNQEGVYRQV